MTDSRESESETARTIADLLGRHVALKIRRFGSPGALLAVNESEEVLLLGAEIPEGADIGDELDVFVYLDSEARPIATTREARLELGEVAFLEVTELTRFGAFVDWGMPKELLVPFAEQTADMRLGSRYAIGLYLDDSGRFAGTMKVSEMLDRARHEGHGHDVQWNLDEWVDGEASVYRIPINAVAGSTTPTLLFGGLGCPEDLDVAKGALFVASECQNSIVQSPVDTAAATSFATIQDVVSVSIDADYVWAISQARGEVYRIPVNGGLPTRVAMGQDKPTGIVTTAKAVFFTHDGNVMRLAK